MLMWKLQAASYPDLAKIFNESSNRFLSVDKTALYWKKTPSRTFIAGEEKSISGFKALTQVDSLLGD